MTAMQTQPALATRVFRHDDQLAFARLSSDWNPMHLDAAFARRTQVGAPVVHGIHHLCWAANEVLRAHPFAVANIRARFPQPLYLDEAAAVHIQSHSDSVIAFEIVAEGTVVGQVKLAGAARKPRTALPRPSQPVTPLTTPSDVAFEQIAGLTGAVAIPDGDLRAAFPALVDAAGLPALAALLGTSQVVGMACPGLHSLFSGIELDVDRTATQGGPLAFAVRKADPRFRSLQMDVAGPGVSGRLEAFARLAPPSQPAMAEVGSRITGQPFAGQRALIVGGSRGLGEVTAKIVAAGGGDCVITYRDSIADAERVAAEIAAAGGRCATLHYDVRAPARAQLASLGAVDSCYYFATPKIFRRKSAVFEDARLQEFLAFYVAGFSDLCAALTTSDDRKIAVFYPSTVAIDQPLAGTAEYAMAKIAGETLADHLTRFTPNIRVLSRRLPRILTDQTATVGVASAHNALDVLLPVVREVQAASRPAPASVR